MSEINKLAHKFDSSNPNINELLDDWLNSYSTIQLGAIGHIFGCIFLFLCLSNIAMAYYSDKLIIYF